MVALVFDTETTHLFRYDRRADQAGQPRMCSLAAGLYDETGQEIEHFYHLVKPEGWDYGAIEGLKESTGIHGLTLERLQDEGLPVLTVLEAYNAFVERTDEGICAFNIHYDQKVIRAERRRAGLPDAYGERMIFCAMHGSRPFCGGGKTVNLARAMKALFDADHEGAHNALEDMRAAGRIYAYLLGQGAVAWKVQESKLKEGI